MIYNLAKQCSKANDIIWRFRSELPRPMGAQISTSPYIMVYGRFKDRMTIIDSIGDAIFSETYSIILSHEFTG